MENCIFCKIVQGALPAEKIYEDAEYLAFMDIRPRAPGHCLVIPKKHYRFVWDVPDIGTYFTIAKTIALAMQRAFGTDTIHSKVEGNEVFHAHVWLYPDPKDAAGEKDDLKGNAQKIRGELPQ